MPQAAATTASSSAAAGAGAEAGQAVDELLMLDRLYLFCHI